MMKKIFLACLLIVASVCFTLEQDSKRVILDDISEDYGLTADNCSQRRVSAIYASISYCEVSSVSSTTSCIQNNLKNVTQQNWDVFAKENGAQAGVSYWYYTNCSIVLNNYGRYNRTYMVWSSQSYQNATAQEEAFPSDMPTGNCSSSRVSAVNLALSACQMADETNTANCVQNRLQSNLTEYWDVYSARSSAQASAMYWYYSDCSLNYNNYGSYNRTFMVWKAQ